MFRVFISHWKLENSVAKLCLFPERAFPIHSNLPVTEYSLATPIVAILNENPVCYTTYLYSTYIVLHTQIIIYIIMYHILYYY